MTNDIKAIKETFARIKESERKIVQGNDFLWTVYIVIMAAIVSLLVFSCACAFADEVKEPEKVCSQDPELIEDEDMRKAYYALKEALKDTEGADVKIKCFDK